MDREPMKTHYGPMPSFPDSVWVMYSDVDCPACGGERKPSLVPVWGLQCYHVDPCPTPILWTCPDCGVSLDQSDATGMGWTPPQTRVY